MKKNLPFIFVLFIWLPVNVMAQSVSVWDGTSEIWTQGSGTEFDPYLIQNAQHLAYIAEMVNGGVTHYENTYFKLTTNVQIDSTTAWNPIGLSETNYFSGHFEGDNHTITLYLHSSLAHVGLFGCVQNASIKNLSIAGEILQQGIAAGSVGGVVSRCLGNSTVSNCHNSGTIESIYSSAGTSTHSYNYSRTGGIVGHCSANTSIINCSNTGDISSRAECTTSTYYNYAMFYLYLGGIVGNVSMNYYYTAIISNCYNTGNISSSTLNNITYCIPFTGGIVGYSTNVNISDCYNAGVISSTSATSHVSAFLPSTGGIVGTNHSATFISDCYNTGNIMAFGHGNSEAGGIIGSCLYNYTVTNCYNTGEVSSSTYYTCNHCCAGGIIGKKEMGSNESICIISNCYNTGIISSTAPQSSSYTGGILGYGSAGSSYALYTPTMSNCYNAGAVSGTNKGGIQGNVAGNVTNCHYLNTCGGTVNVGIEQTEYMMKSSTFPGILNTDSVSFVKDITPNINQGYPIFGRVHTSDADNIGYTTATLHGDYRMRFVVSTHGFEYKKASENNYITVITTGDSPVLQTLTNLQSGAQYTYRFFVQKDGVYYRGANKTFSTMQCTLSAQITSSSNTLCEGDTVIYTATATSSNPTAYQYIWSTGDSLNAISVTNGASYTVTVTDAYGCSATQTKQMTVYPAAVASITGNTVLCNNGSTTLTASDGQYYSWNTGSAQRIITVSQPGTYIATVQTVYGCTASDTVEVTAFANPTINGNLTFCSGDYTTLSASGGDTYLWSNGATTPSINVNSAGSYSVTASTSNGCSGNAAVSVMQTPLPDVQISGNTVICSGVGTTLNATSNASYAWSNGESSQSITANTPGIYSVTVTDANGCSNSVTVNVTMMEPVSISGDTNICSGQSTTLSVNGTGSYEWSNGASTSFVTVTNPGTYTVTVSLPNGCSASATVEVTVASLPTLSISGNTTVCQGQTTTLTANGGNSYIWSNGSTSNSISVSQSGVYTVTATNAEGCSTTTNVTVTINPLPNVNISGDSSFCQGNNTTLTVTGANTYAWSNSQTGNTITVNNAGTYTVTGTDTNGCTKTATKTVSVNPTYNIPLTLSICDGDSYNFYGQNITAAGTYTHTLQTVNGCDSVLTLVVTLESLPTIAILGDTTLCEGGSTTLIATGADTYNWSTGDNTATATISVFGIYTVTGVSALGCSNTASVTVLALPAPQITITGETDICAGESTTLTANGGETYLWSDGTTGNTLTVNMAGTYQVIGYNAAGCYSIADATVSVWQPATSEFSIECPDSCYIWNGKSYCQSGDYTQTLQTAHGCDSVVTLHLTITVGIEDHNLGASMTVYPNPTTAVVNVECAMNDVQAGTVEFHVFDAYGKLVDVTIAGVSGAQGVCDTPLQTAQIDLSPFAPGVYFIKAVADRNVVAVRKIVKQ